MMRWGRKKASSSSSSSSVHSISSVLPIPWFLKPKGMNISSDLKSEEEQRNGEMNVGSGRFQSSGSKVTRLMGREGDKNLNRTRAVRRDNEALPDIKTCERDKAIVIKTPRLTVVRNDQKCKIAATVGQGNSMKLEKISGIARKTISMILEGKYDSARAGSTSRKENKISETSREDSALSMEKLEGSFTLSEPEMNFEWQTFKEMKLKEVKAESEEEHRKSLYISSGTKGTSTKQKQKFRSFSPRASSKVEICRIKALNDMKKAKLKMKAQGGQTVLGSFPVVKCSLDPQKDFRDSMIEMIVEKRIGLPEELEELLACYLTLNSAEYHHMIIKVFRQVWFDLNK